MLTGGSAFGLNASAGVVSYLEEQNIGIKFGGNTIPLVPSAVIFDLGVGSSKVRPSFQEGYAAAKEAKKEFLTGKVGVGTGCTVGKLLGKDFSMEGGLGFSSHTFSDGFHLSSSIMASLIVLLVEEKLKTRSSFHSGAVWFHFVTVLLFWSLYATYVNKSSQEK